jgi:1-phosphofructokinase
MIVTLTLNPSVDRTIEVDALVRGAVVRATGVHVDPGGKGINVSRALAVNAVKTRAVVTTGGAEGRHLAVLLQAEGIDMVDVPVSGATRSNVAVVEPDGTTTKLNEPGAYVPVGELESFLQTVLQTVTASASDADWVVASGSLPPGVADGFYGDVIRALADSGVPVAVDTSGAALVAALEAGPALVKPNLHELVEATGCVIRTIGDVLDAAAQLRGAGARAVLASLGRDGAVLVDDQGTWFAEAPAGTPQSSVGAGDALLAGFLAAGGGGEALAQGVAWGAAAVGLPGSRMPGPDDVIGIRAHVSRPPDRARRLRLQN